MSGAPSEVVEDTTHVWDKFPAERRVAEGSTVSLVTDEVAAASTHREPGGERGGEGGGGEGSSGGGFTRSHGKVVSKGWTRGFLLSSSRQTSGGAPTGKVRLFNTSWDLARVGHTDLSDVLYIFSSYVIGALGTGMCGLDTSCWFKVCWFSVRTAWNCQIEIQITTIMSLNVPVMAAFMF